MSVGSTWATAGIKVSSWRQGTPTDKFVTGNGIEDAADGREFMLAKKAATSAHGMSERAGISLIAVASLRAIMVFA
jgi:hypothetical protein